ncbi:MAG: hypothetical protein WCI02_10045 [Planctomycetota bacterium]
MPVPAGPPKCFANLLLMIGMASLVPISIAYGQKTGKTSPNDQYRDKIWVNKSYNSHLKKVGKKVWQEVDSATGEVRWHFDELAVKEDYIEMILRERKQRIRLFDDRMQLLERKEVKDIAFGHWKSAKKRLAWDSKAYDAVILRLNENSWLEFDNRTKELKVEMRFVSETDDYIELYNPKHHERLRLYEDRMESEHSGQWRSIGGGRWIERDISLLNNIPRANGPESEIDARNLQELVLVDSVKIEHVQDALRRPSIKISVMLRNLSDRPVRVVDGIYHLKNAQGQVVKDIPYTLLADSEPSPGIRPGTIGIAGGILVLATDGISDAAVEITKAFESAKDESERPTVLDGTQVDPLNDGGRIKDSLVYLGMKKYENMDGDVVHLYLTTGEIDAELLEERCRILKMKTDAPYFSCIFVFSSKAEARFPSVSGRVGYGVDFDAYSYIRAAYTFNKKNGYSHLDLSGSKLPQRTP